MTRPISSSLPSWSPLSWCGTGNSTRRCIGLRVALQELETISTRHVAENQTHAEVREEEMKGNASQGNTSTRRVVVETEEELRSTPEHRFWVGLTTILLTGTLFNGINNIHGIDGAAWAIGWALLAYSLADFGTGVYHWGVDNYGDANTPVFGSQIAAFQGHHQRPWTITEREFCNNVHKVFKPAALPAALLFASSFVMPSSWSVWSSLFLFLACMSQQFHAWSHMKRSELHPLVVAAQDSGLLISRKAHGAHHKAPFEGNYCIVSGHWNSILDGDGSEESFFRRLERFIYNMWGVEPRCWKEPQDDWLELERNTG